MTINVDILAWLIALTRYIILNRTGSGNLLEASSRNYSPLTTFHEIK